MKVSEFEKMSDSSLLGLIKGEMEDNFYLFLQWAFRIVNPETKLILNWHVQYICDIIQHEIERIKLGLPKTQDIIINVPPRSLKSFICNVAAPAWSWLKVPTMKWISSSYSADLSLEHNVNCRKIVESPVFLQLWPELLLAEDQNQKKMFENMFGGGKKATSTGGSVTGSGGDIILVDDPLDPKKARSDKERLTANLHIDNTLSSRFNDPATGVMIVIMQRLHENDTTGHLLKKNPFRYKHICIPAFLDKNVKPKELAKHYVDDLFFPARFPKIILDNLKGSMTLLEFEGQYKQNPAPIEGNIIKRQWFKFIGRDDFNKLVQQTQIVQRVFILDTAFTEKKGNDASGYLASTKINGIIYLYKATKVWKDFPSLLKYTVEFVNENGYDYKSMIRIEPKANGISLVQQLQYETELNVVTLPAPVDSKDIRLNAISTKVEAGKVVLIEDNWNEEFIEDVTGFPNREDKEWVDCLSYTVDYWFNDSKQLFPFELMLQSIQNMANQQLHVIIKNCPLWDKFDYVITGVYFAKNNSNYNVFATFGVDESNCFYLINFHRIKTDNIMVLVNQILQINNAFEPNIIVVEDDRLNKIYSTFKKDIQIRVKSEKESSWNIPFEKCFDHLAVLFRQNKIKLPYENENSKEIAHLIMTEFNTINIEESKIDDLIAEKGIVKTFWLAIKGLYLTGAKIYF